VLTIRRAAGARRCRTDAPRGSSGPLRQMRDIGAQATALPADAGEEDLAKV